MDFIRAAYCNTKESHNRYNRAFYDWFSLFRSASPFGDHRPRDEAANLETPFNAFPTVSDAISWTKSSLEIEGLSLDEPKSEGALLKITGRVSCKGMDEGASAWIGVVPSHIAHGSEEAVDQEDLIYSYLSNLENDAYYFQLELAPGSYDIRICDNDDGGVEVAFLPFTVK